MRRMCVAVLGTALAAGLPCRSDAGSELTLEAALALARQRSPRILAARGRAGEAEARLRVRPPLRDNPLVEGAWGSRRGASPSDFEVGLSQTFELGGRSGARRAVDEASLARDRADAGETERIVLREVRTAFLQALHAGEQLRLANAVEEDAVELHRIAARRYEAGDVAALELNVAASGLARARAQVKAGEAAEASAHGELTALLDLAASEPLALVGELDEPRSYDEARLLAGIEQLPEVRALEAELRGAEAEARLGQGHAWPDLTPRVSYERDEGDEVLWAGLAVTLPVFERGQTLRATGEARAGRLRAELEARKRVLRSRLQSALAVHELRLAAVRELAADTERLADNESLARRSYEVGQIGLGELLLLRRETVDARRQWLDSLLELAQARAELDSLSGGPR